MSTDYNALPEHRLQCVIFPKGAAVQPTVGDAPSGGSEPFRKLATTEDINPVARSAMTALLPPSDLVTTASCLLRRPEAATVAAAAMARSQHNQSSKPITSSRFPLVRRRSNPKSVAMAKIKIGSNRASSSSPAN
ncbi:hypothetical protein ACLOJK_004688 [Asimina triloba]